MAMVGQSPFERPCALWAGTCTSKCFLTGWVLHSIIWYLFSTITHETCSLWTAVIQVQVNVWPVAVRETVNVVKSFYFLQLVFKANHLLDLSLYAACFDRGMHQSDNWIGYRIVTYRPFFYFLYFYFIPPWPVQHWHSSKGLLPPLVVKKTC